MKKTLFKLVLCLFLFSLLCVGLTLAAGAQTPVASVEGTTYNTLAEAIGAAEAGQTVTLLDHADLTAITIKESIIIDGTEAGKYTVSGSGSKTAYLLTAADGAIVTLKNVKITGSAGYLLYVDGSATVNLENAELAAAAGDRIVQVVKGSMLNIDNGSRVVMEAHTASATTYAVVNYGALHCHGTISIDTDWKGQVSAIVNYASSSNADTAVYVYEGALIEAVNGNASTAATYSIHTQTPVYVYGGEINGTNGALYLNINSSTSYRPNMTMTGGTLQGEHGVRFKSAAMVSLSGGTIDGTVYGVYLETAGTFTMTGGAVTGPQPIYVAAAGTLNITGGAVTVSDGGAKNSGVIHLAGAASVTVGGTASVTNALAAGNYTGIWIAADGATVAVSGGTIEARYPIWAYANCDVELSGGTLSVASAGGAAIQIQNGSKTLTVELTVTAGTVQASGSFRANGINVNNAATVTASISGGRFETITSLNNAADGATITLELSGSAELCGGGNANDAAIKITGAGSKLTFSMTGGRVESDYYGIWVARGYGAVADIDISGGSFVTADCCLRISGVGSSVAVTGGSFVTANGDSAADISCDESYSNCTMTVYGGYFEGSTLGTVRTYYDATMTIYGGTFHYLPASNAAQGNVVRIGASGAAGKVYVYGGNFYSANVYGAVIDTVASGGYALVEAGTFVGGLCPLKNTGTGTASISYPVGVNRLTLNGLTMETGAQTRIVTGSTGLRFMGKLSAAAYAYLLEVADTDSLSFGTLIVPTDYLEQLSAFTLAQLKAAGLTYLDLAAVDGLIENADGSLTVRAAIVNIRQKNLARSYSAVTYAKYKVDGHEVYYYADFREAGQSRDIYHVAKLALEDISTTQTTVYCYAYNGGYSRYSETQRGVLLGYYDPAAATSKTIDIYLIAGQSNGAGSSIYSEEFADSVAAFKAGYTNIYYAGTAATDANGFRASAVVDLAPVTIGLGRCDTRIGAELGMAEALSSIYNGESSREALILKYASGGTSLSDILSGNNATEGNWAPPSYLEVNGAQGALSGGLYRNFMAQVEKTVTDLRAKGYDVNVAGLFWMQGESDYKLEGALDRYTELLDYLVDDMRTDIGALVGQDLTEMPFLIGEISFTCGMVHNTLTEEFIALQNSFAASKENVYIVPIGSLGVGTNAGDLYHWGCDEMLLIGKTVATVLLNAINGTQLAMPAVSGAAIAEVLDSEGASLGTYTSLSFAIGQAPEGATVKLLSDVTLYSSLNISNANAITVDGNGFTITSYSVDYGITAVGCNAVLTNFKMVLNSDSYFIFCYDSPALSVTDGEVQATLGIGAYEAADNDVTGVVINDGVLTMS